MNESHEALALYFDKVISKYIVILTTLFLTHRPGRLRGNTDDALAEATQSQQVLQIRDKTARYHLTRLKNGEKKTSMFSFLEIVDNHC